MSGQGDIWIEGEKELYMNMQKHLGASMRKARQGIRKAGMNIIADAKQNLTNGRNVASGMLRASGRVQAVEGDPDSIDCGFFSKDTGGYATYVEYGRRAGKMPPLDIIKQWVRKKGSGTKAGSKSALKSAAVFVGKTIDGFITSVAWAIARSIAKNGTRPHPFFEPAVRKNEDAISEAIAEAIKEEIQ